MKKISVKNVSIRKHNGTVLARVQRKGLRQSRTFLVSKFGGLENAVKKASEYATFLKKKATDTQFKKARRRVGRPSKTEFFGRRIINN
jgi:hypothetical protein